MKCSFDIDFKRKTIFVEKKLSTLSTELKRKTTEIDRIVSLWLIEKQRKTILITKPNYKVIRVNVPYFTDWVILQNEYLPHAGEYFLN